jgi:hypothetical protein
LRISTAVARRVFCVSEHHPAGVPGNMDAIRVDSAGSCLAEHADMECRQVCHAELPFH